MPLVPIVPIGSLAVTRDWVQARRANEYIPGQDRRREPFHNPIQHRCRNAGQAKRNSV